MPTRHPPRLPRAALTLLLPLLLLAACGTPDGGSAPAPEDPVAATSPAQRHDPPAAAGALAPQLAAARDGGVHLSWLEPTAAGHRLRTARFDGAAWSEPVTVTAGDRFFANWADTPSVVEGSDGTLLAHWLAMIGDGTYAYGVHLARSTDGGASWRDEGLLHVDASPTEHGFVSLLPDPGGGFDAVWLDGREMEHGGAMTLRHRRLEADGAKGPETVLDPRVCECCQTSAARATGAPLVTYRNRSPQEIRDVSAVRKAADGWTTPRTVHGDGWHIAGCPVNGPAVAAGGDHAAVAWFTAADGDPRVQAAFSADAGATWSTPVLLDGDAPLGRVDLVRLDDGTAAVSWLGGDGGVWLRRVGPDGGAGEALQVAATSTARASGFPRLERNGDVLYVAWVEVAEEGDGEEPPQAVLFASLPAAALPAADGP